MCEPVRGGVGVYLFLTTVPQCTVFLQYYYYFVAGLVGKGYRPWWRVYITTFQLTQFVSVFVNIFVWYYISLENPKFNLSWPFLTYDSSKCSGDVWVVNFSQSVNVSFLFLFGQFFVANYLYVNWHLHATRQSECFFFPPGLCPCCVGVHAVGCWTHAARRARRRRMPRRPSKLSTLAACPGVSTRSTPTQPCALGGTCFRRRSVLARVLFHHLVTSNVRRRLT